MLSIMVKVPDQASREKIRVVTLSIHAIRTFQKSIEYFELLVFLFRCWVPLWKI